MKDKKDIIEALKKVNFLERTEALAEKYKLNPQNTKILSPRKDKVFEIIQKLGYIPNYAFNDYEMKKADGSKNRFEIMFDIYYSWVQFAFYYREDGLITYSGAWWKIKAQVANDEDYRSGSPAFTSYEELEEIITEAVKIYEDSVKALYEED